MMIANHSIWTLTADSVYETLGTSPQGLSNSDAALRLEHDGFNELPEPVHRSLWLRFADQLTHFMALLLWVAGILAFISRTPELGWAIWAVVLINALFSFWQEFQAEQALAALKKVLPMQVKVYRQGQLIPVLARELVRGDVVQMEEGDRVPADMRLVSAESFYVDVSILTGESLPVARQADPVQPRPALPVRGGKTLLRPGEIPQQERVNPAEIRNLVFAGATVSSGRAMGVVYATGAQTEFGHVAHLTTIVERAASTLEVQITRIVRVITAIALTMGITVFLLSYYLIGMDVKESFIFAIGIIVANVPEGLLPTVTLSLAMGVQRMAKRNALVRRLSSVETLSATNVICTDKTGTLTKNEMTVRALWLPSSGGGESIGVSGVGYDPTAGEVNIPAQIASWQVKLLLTGAALCSNARLIHPTGESRWQEMGDPTEAALLVAALKAQLNLKELQQQCPRLREVPFDSRRRMMTVVLDWHRSDLWSNESTELSFTKGAPLEVLRRCHSILQEEDTQVLTEMDWQRIVTANDDLAKQGYRVLGIAARKGNDLRTYEPQVLEQDLIFIGLMAMFDPPRPEAEAAIAHCHQAGIQVTMITGDYGLTAAAIARRIGLVQQKARVVTGDGLGHLSDAQLRQLLKYRTGLVFARMSPEHKLRLVQAYQSLGYIVAVTGDGVNDAPALRAGNIGIAMGMNGTDVAREAADIVLTDDNFATIVSAIEEGRSVYQNIRKFMTYILASNIPEIVPFLAMVLFKIPPALTILQILAIDLGTDLLPALALGAEPPEPGIMNHPPRSPQQKLLNRSLLLRAYGFLGAIEAVLSLLGFFIVWWAHGYGLAEMQQATAGILSRTADPAVMAIYQQSTTVALAAIVACQVGNVFACRSEWASALRLSWFNNRLIWVGIAAEVVLLCGLIYLPPLQAVFMTAAIAHWQWLLLLFCPPLLLGAEELRKRLVRQKVH
jgi:magnesium-transporting ATPase (P-type)